MLESLEPLLPFLASCRGRTVPTGFGGALEKSLIPVMHPKPLERKSPRQMLGLSGNNRLKGRSKPERSHLSGRAPGFRGQRQSVLSVSGVWPLLRWSPLSSPARVKSPPPLEWVLAQMRPSMLRLPLRRIRALPHPALLLGPMPAVVRARTRLVRGVDPVFLGVAAAGPLAVVLEPQDRGEGAGAPALVPPPLLQRLSLPPPPLPLVCEVVPATPMQLVEHTSFRVNRRRGLLRPGHPRSWRIMPWSLTPSTQCGPFFGPCPLKRSPGPLRLFPRNICVNRAMARFLTARSRLRPFG